MDKQEDRKPFVSRGGIKLQAALEAFRIDACGLVCADLGSNIGGFVDCLLQNGAEKVYSVDTSYGTLAWKLRQNPRVVVMERTNALHAALPEKADLVTVDVGWTPQRLILPNAVKMLKAGGRIAIIDKNAEQWGKLQTPEWEQWFTRKGLERLLRRDCREVSSRYISYWEDVEPDGLFLAWLAVK